MTVAPTARRSDAIPRCDSVAALRLEVRAWRAGGHSIALVPTMGALHLGHLALVEAAMRRCRRVVASIFVNPSQFGPGEDYDSYPRDELADRTKLASMGADLVYCPSVAEMYPDGFSTAVRVGKVTSGLCGDRRPGHFAGVATAVTKLLMQCQPDVAVFGEKDYQQLVTIRRLVRDLDIPVEIVGVPTLREDDGLAMSSRNVNLDARERIVAASLYTVLTDTARRIGEGGSVMEALGRGREALVQAGFPGVEYIELRDAATLEPVLAVSKPARLLAAVRIGATRLIDNVSVTLG